MVEPAEAAENEEKEEYPSETPEDKLKIPYVEKALGGESFRAGAFEKAIKHYSKSLLGVRFLREAGQINDEETKSRYRKDIELPVSLNMALCSLNTKNYPNAVRYAGAALELDPLNCKGLYRRGLAHHMSAEVPPLKDEAANSTRRPKQTWRRR